MLLEFNLFKPHRDKIVHGVTTRLLGSFNDEEENFENQLKKLSALAMGTPVLGKQIHSDRILVINDLPTTRPEGDGFMTTREIPIAVKIADCQGILIYDPTENAAAAIHSGWRGSAQNILGKAVKMMNGTFGSQPQNLLVGIGPSLGPCCAEFTDPKAELPEQIHPYIYDRNVDFWSLSLHQLSDAGIPKDQIEIIAECTKCNREKYYSHRNQDTGRMAVFIGLK